ncbi:MAG TPA: tryptophan halogenase family protein [Steroidobacteraceae bacterium]|nr:tryptophan halogenase family protein [Steroidobacteraceae bacterium]
MPTRPESQPVRKVVVVGGGTAGWITAGVLASRYPQRGEDGVEITLIESRQQPPIGVGEGTWPTIRSTLKQIGVSETDFLRECDASFKQGSQFLNWVDGSHADAYYHPFTLPVGYEERNLAPYWLEDPRDRSFAADMCFQAELCSKGLAPKQITTPEFAGLANYAYHLDAGKFGPFLRKHCIDKLGVNHVYDEIVRVQSDDAGDIAHLVTKSGDLLAADLFIDCSGFSSLLIGKHFGVPFLSKKDVLFIDKAWAVQIPYSTEDAAIASVTLSTAQASGWVWDIGLTTRRGVGYVFSSGYVSDDDALEELQSYLKMRGDPFRDLSFRKIDINSGYRQEFWTRNCVAVGLSAGFLEPLEASAIVMIELSAKSIANLLPSCRSGMRHAARLFNDTFRYYWERIIDFLKLHYALSRRTDSKFWIDNRCSESIPDSLRDGLDFWRYHSPWHEDLSHREEVFSAASYQYVLYGMGFRTEPARWLLNDRNRNLAREKMNESANYAKALSASLPGNRDLLTRIRRYGLQKI